MTPINSATLCRRACAISLSAVQNASSMLTLVLWPAMMIERLITGDFIAAPRKCVSRAQRSMKWSAAEPGPVTDAEYGTTPDAVHRFAPHRVLQTLHCNSRHGRANFRLHRPGRVMRSGRTRRSNSLADWRVYVVDALLPVHR